MRKAVALFILLIGLVPGLLLIKDDWDSRVAMMIIGLAFVAPIAGIIAGVGKKKRIPLNCRPAYGQKDFELPGKELSPTNLASPYFSHEGHLPLSESSLLLNQDQNDPKDFNRPRNFDEFDHKDFYNPQLF